jgi:hypothetical protein
MNDKPIEWEMVASMEQVQKDHPGWTEEQCREEFTRLSSAAVQKMLDERENRRRKRKKP